MTEPAKDAASAAIPFREAFRFWLKLGFISFGGPAGQIVAGEPRIIPADKPVTVRLPDGRERVIAPEREGQAVFKDTYLPGHYFVSEPGPSAREPLTFAVQQDPAESDTTPVAVRPPSLDGDQVMAAAQHPRWRPLVLLAALLLLLETLLRVRTRR